MNLWIKSQDNDLSIIEDIKQPIIHNSGLASLDGYSSKGRYIRLGTYENIGRALEVLDEIQEVLKPKYRVDTNSIKLKPANNDESIINASCNYELLEYSTYVYKMPND